MSRSRKKNAYWGQKDKFFKNYANRVVRSKLIDYEIADGKAYRKEFCSYDIADYGGCWWSYQEYKQHIESCKVKYPRWCFLQEDHWYREIMK